MEQNLKSQELINQKHRLSKCTQTVLIGCETSTGG